MEIRFEGSSSMLKILRYYYDDAGLQQFDVSIIKDFFDTDSSQDEWEEHIEQQ